MRKDETSRHVTIMVVPEGAQESRSYRLSYGQIRLLGAVATTLALMFTVMAVSWWCLAAKAG